MKLKITDDFKKCARGMLIYMITFLLIYPLFHLIKGDFSWEDTLNFAGLQLVIAVVLGVLFFFGFQIPEKDDQ